MRTNGTRVGASTRFRLFGHTATRLLATSGTAEGDEPNSSSTDNNNNNNYRSLLRRGAYRLFFKEQQGLETSTEIQIQPQTSPIENYLYLLPDSLHRYYRPLPSILRALTLCLATWAAFVSTNWTTTEKTLLPTVSVRLVRRVAGFLFKSVAWSLIAQVVLQDTLFVDKLQSSRVTMKTLVQKHFLPSSLSKYNPVTIDPIASSESKTIIEGASPTAPNAENEPFTLGVHYLQYENTSIEKEVEGKDKEDEDDDSVITDSAATSSTNPSKKPKKRRTFEAMYFQHGFGASSLSWLPVLPALAKQMNARVALGHDTVGFGFTDRPKDQRWYRPRQSSRIAEAILAKESQAVTNLLSSGDDETKPKNAAPAPVCLVGHSMGSRSTLRLATQLPLETPKLIILSSPALGLISPKPPRSSKSKPAQLASSLTTAVSRKILKPAFKYFLRRVIGFNGSWRKGLEGVWGDPKKVSEDSDVLRYSWPSIGYGWEEGILNFVGAQVLPADDELDDDFLLLRRVLDLPHTKVLIVLGSRDRVIPTKSVEKFVERVASLESSSGEKNNNNVPIVELEGLGHCAFEEDREAFCDAVEQLVRDHWDTRT
jgi:pimeloyl-ACP methyl ester carboxylesterase